MCLWIDYDDDGVYLGGGRRKARKAHRCGECGRTIEPGETYRYWTWVFDGRADDSRLCAHCDAAIDLGHVLTGCPRQWNWSMLYDTDPEIGYLANCASPDEHPTLTDLQRLELEHTRQAGARGWKGADGQLMATPVVPQAVG